MIIIALYQNGVAEIVSPSRIFQGTDSEQIVVLSPYPYTVPLQISYTSPKGVNNGYVPMQPIDLPSDYTTVSAWQYSPGSSWTQNYGTAYINLLVNLPTETSGTYGQLTTFMCQITIEQSILPTLPPTPTQDVYDQILEYLGAYADLNERINNLEQAEVTGVKGAAETTFRTGDVNITPANIGLGNVDNTSDQDKPVSTAQQEALNALQQEVESYAETTAEAAQSAAVNTANEYTDGQISSLQTTLEDYTNTQVANGVTEAVQQAKEYTDDQFGIKVGTTVTVGGLAQATVDLDTAMVGGVIATKLSNQNIDTFVGADYWGKVFYIPGGSGVTGLPQNTNGGTLEVLQGGGVTTIHRFTATSDTSGESISPNMLQRQYNASWSDWEKLVSADGSYPTLGAGYLAKNVQIAASSSQSSVGWWRVGSIDLSAIGRATVSTSTVILVTGLYTHISETGLLEVNGRLQDGVLNPTASPVYLTFGNLETNDFCVAFEGTVITLYTYITGVYIRSSFTIIQDATEVSSNTNYFTFSPSYYGSTAPEGAVYAVLRNNASSAITDGNGNNIVNTYATQNGTYSQMTVGNATNATNATNVTTSINGQAISDIFDTDGRSALNAINVGDSIYGKNITDIFRITDMSAINAINLLPDTTYSSINPDGRASGTVGTGSVAFGNAVASGQDSIAINGKSNNSSSCIASGSFSIALGGSSTASGDSSFAVLGSANGNDSIALGSSAKSNAEYSTAVGPSAQVYGSNSTALGRLSEVTSIDSNTIQLGDAYGLSTLRSRVNLTVTSDARDKTDISTITNSLAFLEKLNPVTFVSNDRVNYISDEGKQSENYRKYGMCDYDREEHLAGTKKGKRRRIGLLAQEVMEAMKEVYGTDNYANIVNDNFYDLEEKPNVENKLTLAYANLVPFLIGAIKELSEKIKGLEKSEDL